MKRVLAGFLTLTMMLSLCACGGKTPESTQAPETTEAAPCAEDSFAVEEMVYEARQGEFKNFKIKIRNLTDKRIHDLHFSVQALDAAGDVLDSWNIGSSDALDAGQAYWFYCGNDLFDPCKTIKEAAKAVPTIRVVSVSVQTVRNDPKSWVDLEFRDAPTFAVAETPLRGRNMHETFAPKPPVDPNAPRVIGPETIEGKDLTIQGVSVEFFDQLPREITGSSTYSFCGNKEDFVLNESQVYAAIRFTLTNQTAEEIKISDIHDDFVAELVYDNEFSYNSNSDSTCFFKSGSQVAAVEKMSSIGKVTIAPLVTAEAVIFIPCARAVSDGADKNLDVTFTSHYTTLETYDFVIR